MSAYDSGGASEAPGMAGKQERSEAGMRRLNITVPAEVLDELKRLATERGMSFNLSSIATKAFKKELTMSKIVAEEVQGLEGAIKRLRVGREATMNASKEAGVRSGKRFIAQATAEDYDVIKWFEAQAQTKDNVDALSWVDSVDQEATNWEAIGNLRDRFDPEKNGHDAEEFWASFATAALELWGKIQGEVEKD